MERRSDVVLSHAEVDEVRGVLAECRQVLDHYAQENFVPHDLFGRVDGALLLLHAADVQAEEGGF